MKMPPKKARAEEELLLLVKLHSVDGVVDWVGGVVVLVLFSLGAEGVVVVEVVEVVDEVVLIVVVSDCFEGVAVSFFAPLDVIVFV